MDRPQGRRNLLWTVLSSLVEKHLRTDPKKIPGEVSISRRTRDQWSRLIHFSIDLDGRSLPKVPNEMCLFGRSLGSYLSARMDIAGDHFPPAHMSILQTGEICSEKIGTNLDSFSNSIHSGKRNPPRHASLIFQVSRWATNRCRKER